MSLVPLSIATWNYDRVAPLRDGRIRIEGVDAHFFPLQIEELFYRVFHNHEFDIVEMSLSSYLMARTRGLWAYEGVPVFLSRMFRHSAVFVKTESDLDSPQALRGLKVGVPEYAQTAAVTVRGVFADDYGVNPADIHWHTGGLEQPGRHEKFPLELPADVRVTHRTDKALTEMLMEGEIDALVTARNPSGFYPGGPIRRLFRDHGVAERDYYKRTGIFPIMHLVGVRSVLVERYPWLACNVAKAFSEAKRIVMDEVDGQGGTNVGTLPWMSDAVAEARALMGDDYWPYGISANRASLEAAIGWSHAQGLSRRIIPVEEMFVASTRGEFRV